MLDGTLTTSIRLFGSDAAILYGYHEAAVLRRWTIAKVGNQWTLTARSTRVEPFMLTSCKPLLFTAPHEGARDGFWAWGIESLECKADHIVAILGPPEQ